MSKKHVMYPFRRISFSRNNNVIEKAMNFFGFYCEECFEPIILKGNISVNLGTIEKETDITVRFIDHYEIECPVCHHHTIWTEHPLDPNIAPMIAMLNQKGYMTEESCEGHGINRLDALYPYIKFKYPGQKKVCTFIELPGPWKLKQDTNDFILYCESNDPPIRERMAHLRIWVKALPECHEPVFSASMLSDNYKEKLLYLNKPLAYEDTGLSFDEMDLHNLTEDEVIGLAFTEADFDEMDPEEIQAIHLPNPFDGVEAARARAWARKQEELAEWRKTRRLGKEKFKDHQKEIRARLDRRAAGLPEEEPVVRKKTKGDPNLPYNGKQNSPREYVPKEIRDLVPHTPKRKEKPKGPRNYKKKRRS